MRYVALLGALAALGCPSGAALAQKSGGVLKMYHRDNPPTLSIHETATNSSRIGARASVHHPRPNCPMPQTRSASAAQSSGVPSSTIWGIPHMVRNSYEKNDCIASSRTTSAAALSAALVVE